MREEYGGASSDHRGTMERALKDIEADHERRRQWLERIEGISRVALISLGVGVLAVLFTFGAANDSTPSWLKDSLSGALMLLGIVVPFAVAAMVAIYNGILKSWISMELNERTINRKPLVVRMRKFAARQERFRALEDMMPLQWKDWARRRFREIIEEWPKEFEEYEDMRADEDFDVALREWSPAGAQSSSFEMIWGKRQYIYNWARFKDTPEERFKAGYESQSAIEEMIHETETQLQLLRRMREQGGEVGRA
ncbi:MAG: hypothetical protein HKN10_05345 [Myxococcales bacterium]|nr:hypothetical protein [Myxococcales bacterium]